MSSELSQLLNVDSLDIPEAGGEAPLVRSTPAVEADSLIREMISLDPEDIQALKSTGPEHALPTLKHVRAYHHIIALRLATGERPGVIAATLGIGAPTLSKLQKDPQFIDLVETYRSQMVEKAINTTEIIGAVSYEALTALHERLISDERDEIPLEALRRIAETALDRFGHSPVRRAESVNHHEHSLSHATLERVKKLHSEDATYHRPEGQSEPAALAEGPAPHSSSPGSFRSEAILQESAQVVEVEFSSEKGKDLREQGGEADKG